MRRQMEGYSQTPPEGLWESVQAGLEGRRTAAFPWWWMLAGAAAAVVAALLLLVRPSGNPGPVNPSLTAETDQVDSVEIVAPAVPAEPDPTMPDDRQIQLIQDIPGKSAFARKAIAKVQPVDESPVAPAAEELNEEPESPIVEDDFPPDIVVPDEAEQQQEEESKPSVHPVPLRQYPAERRLLASADAGRVKLSLFASGAPGGNVSNTITEYGMGSAMRMGFSSKTSPRSLTSVLSQNRSTVTESNYSLMYRFGVLANIPVSNRWSIDTGLQLSHLAGTVKSTSGTITTELRSDLYYVGIPLHAVFTPWEGRHLGIYFSAGPMAEYGVRLKGTTKEIIGTIVKSTPTITHPGDLIWSLGADAGVQWRVGGLGALFLQPGVSWHIPAANSPESYYTEHPVAFNLAAGFRILF